jgi:hypothetical protein
MPLSRHLETIRIYIRQGNRYCAEKVAESLMRQYSRKADQAKIQAALQG